MPGGLSFAPSTGMTHTPIHNRGPEEEKREAAVNESADDQARRARTEPAETAEAIPQQGTNKSKGLTEEPERG
jgi:hypothetical protein